VPYLISQVSASEGDELELLVQGMCAFLLGICVLENNNQVPNYHQSDLRQMIEKRVGMEQFTDKMSQLTKHESYSRAAKKPQLVYKQPNEVLFDYEFTQLLRKLESDVLKAVSPMQDVDGEKKRASVEQHDSIVEQYKKIIREQDIQLNATRGQLNETLNRTGDSQRRLEELTQQIQQLKDQNALLKTQRGSSAGLQTDLEEMSRLHKELEDCRRDLQEKNQKVDQLTADLLSAESRLALSIDVQRSASNETSHHSNDESAAVDELRHRLSEREEELLKLQRHCEDLRAQLTQASNLSAVAGGDQSSVIALMAERNNLSVRVSELELKIARHSEERSETDVRIQHLKRENDGLLQRIQSLEGEKTEVEVDKDQTLAEMDNMKKEQDDLLVLLTEQENKIKAYRNRLKALGEQVEDDDDDADDLEGDDAEENDFENGSA